MNYIIKQKINSMTSIPAYIKDVNGNHMIYIAFDGKNMALFQKKGKSIYHLNMTIFLLMGQAYFVLLKKGVLEWLTYPEALKKVLL